MPKCLLEPSPGDNGWIDRSALRNFENAFHILSQERWVLYLHHYLRAEQVGHARRLFVDGDPGEVLSEIEHTGD